MNSKTIRLIASAAALAVLGLGGAQAATDKGSSAKALVRGVSASAFTQVSSTPRVNTVAASDLIVNLAGISSFDGIDDPINTVLTLSAVAGSTVDALSWSVSLSTVGASWLSEASILITNSMGDGVYFAPGFGDDVTGAATYSDSVLLSDYSLTFSVLADGVLYVQFFEDFDDNVGSADALYSAGSLTLGGIAAAVPEPSTYGLMALGLFAVGAAARRRKA